MACDSYIQDSQVIIGTKISVIKKYVYKQRFQKKICYLQLSMTSWFCAVYESDDDTCRHLFSLLHYINFEIKFHIYFSVAFKIDVATYRLTFLFLLSEHSFSLYNYKTINSTTFYNYKMINSTTCEFIYLSVVLQKNNAMMSHS